MHALTLAAPAAAVEVIGDLLVDEQEVQSDRTATGDEHRSGLAVAGAVHPQLALSDGHAVPDRGIRLLSHK